MMKAPNTATITTSNGIDRMSEMVEMIRDVSMSPSGSGMKHVLESSSHVQEEPTPPTLTFSSADAAQSARFVKVPHVPSSWENEDGYV